MTDKKDNQKVDKKDLEKMESLKRIIEEAEKSLYSARAMLMRLENKTGVKEPSVNKKTYGASPDGKIIEGVFDGQHMIGNDGKQYPVPANYASKSKLVEGDMLKLTITDDGNFVYKQIGPVERKRLIGIIGEDEYGNFLINSEGKNYKVLLASVTYYKAQSGDEVTIVIPRSGDPVWCAIENVTKKSFELDTDSESKGEDLDQDYNEIQDPFLKNEVEIEADIKTDVDKEQEPEGEKKEETDSVDQTKQKGDRGAPEKNDIGDPFPIKKEKLAQVAQEWTPELGKMEQEARTSEQDTDQKSDSDKKNIRKRRHSQTLVNKDLPDTPEEVLEKSKQDSKE